MLPVPEFQTKVPLYGRDHSRKVQAMKQAKDRKKQLARLGQTSTLDFTPLSLDKLEPEFVSEKGTSPRPAPEVISRHHFFDTSLDRANVHRL